MSSKKSHSILAPVATVLAAVTGVAAGAAAVIFSNPKNRQQLAKSAKKGLKSSKFLTQKLKTLKKAI